MHSLKPLLVPVIVLLILAYGMVHTSFNIYFVDDSWTLSNTWNYTYHGSNEDLIFVESDAPGRPQFFSKTYHYIGGQIYNYWGWSKSNAFILNSIFIGFAALVWWFILKRLPFSKTVAQLFVIFLPLCRPCFHAAHTARPDAFTFLLVSLVFLQFIHRRYILAGLLLIMAIETHIMGVIGVFYLLAYSLYKRDILFFDLNHFGKMSLQFSIGILLGLVYYWCLHWEVFSLETLTLLITSKRDMNSPVNNYILAYFSDFDWASHFWEFILLSISFFFYFKNKLYRTNNFLAILLIVLVLSTLITRRENRTYFIFIFPAFLLMIFYTFEQIKQLPLFLKALCLTLMVYFGGLYYGNGWYRFDDLSEQISKSLVKKNLPVLGVADVWFAAKDRTFYPITHRDFNQIELQHFYLVETNHLAERHRDYPYLMNYFLQNYNCVCIKEIPVFKGEKINCYECQIPENFQPNFTKQVYPGWKTMLKRHWANAFD